MFPKAKGQILGRGRDKLVFLPVPVVVAHVRESEGLKDVGMRIELGIVV